MTWCARPFPSLARQDLRDCEGSESHILITFGDLKTKDSTELQAGERKLTWWKVWQRLYSLDIPLY